MKIKHLPIIQLVLAYMLILPLLTGAESSPTSAPNAKFQRVWIGADFWANPLEDWCWRDGKIVCVGGRNRKLYLLTKELSSDSKLFSLQVSVGALDPKSTAGCAGIEIGIKGRFGDYRDSAIRGKGLRTGVTANGKIFIGDSMAPLAGNALPAAGVKLVLKGTPTDKGSSLSLSALDASGTELASVRKEVPNNRVSGGIALFCAMNPVASAISKRSLWRPQPNLHNGFWFKNLNIDGEKIASFPERAFGPILFAQYTLSRSVLKLTAQMTPLGNMDGKKVLFQARKNGDWKTLAEAPIDTLARTARFKIKHWSGAEDLPYRLAYTYKPSPTEAPRQAYFEGVIRKEPWGKEEFVIAAFTGNNDSGYPPSGLIRRVEKENPDLLFFSGDQIYEPVGGYGVVRSPLDRAVLDYLRKWYIFGWAYRDLMKNRPTICLPDDHDVFHGNLWGCGGKATGAGLHGNAAQDSGGYKMPPKWVNMVERTQTSHLPDPYNPAPVKQGIGVYYCSMTYAGVSFAIIEDRKFKSAPKPLLPKANINNGWARNPKFNPKTESDAPSAKLLGQRQLDFLEHWVTDWRGHAWIKVVLSATIFANVATLPESIKSDRTVPRLKIFPFGEYPPDDRPVADMDSNGWPKTGRNKAVRVIRKAFAFHIAGDQHLGSFVQYGLDNWRDSGFAFCVPSVSNIWPRRWFPSLPGKNRGPGAPKYTGDFEDGFGNKVTVLAAANPVATGKNPAHLYDRSTGFGIVRLNRETRDITIDCIPRFPDLIPTSNGSYYGWPIKINMMDNYSPNLRASLPTIQVSGARKPVVRVIDPSTGKTIYCLRLYGNQFSLKVPKPGVYNLEISDPDMGSKKTLKNLKATKTRTKQIIKVSLSR